MNKAFYILFFFFFIQNPCKTQNLIYNGDFEIYDTCPSNLSTPGDLQIEHCLGWTAPTKLGTSDYFNVCNNATMFQLAGVPQNFLGYQQPFNGSGYCGLLAWALNLNDGSSYREYLQAQLQQPLTAGNKYHFSFFVSYYGINYSVEKIGALFSLNNFNATTFSPIVASPQVLNMNGIITDSLGWTKIEGEFIANGGELFLTIGYFEDSLTVVDTLNTHNEIFVVPESYYFVDGVELIEVSNEIVIPNIFSPNRDEVNEIFKIENAYGKTEMKIFNRWGELVYFAEGRNCYWDGRTYAGVECPEGVYYYSIKIEEKEFKGFVHLVRKRK